MKEQLNDFLAEVVTNASWANAIIPKILRSERGEWLALPNLLEDEPRETYLLLLSQSEYDIMVTCLDHPLGLNNMVLVLFYLEDEMYTYIAIVNQLHFSTGSTDVL